MKTKIVQLFCLFTLSSLAVASPDNALAFFWSNDTTWEKTVTTDRGDRYTRNQQKRGDIVTYEDLEDLFSPIRHDGKLVRSIIYYEKINCKRRTRDVTALELFAGQMGSGDSWAGPSQGNIPLDDVTYNKFCL